MGLILIEEWRYGVDNGRNRAHGAAQPPMSFEPGSYKIIYITLPRYSMAVHYLCGMHSRHGNQSPLLSTDAHRGTGRVGGWEDRIREDGGGCAERACARVGALVNQNNSTDYHHAYDHLLLVVHLQS